MAEIENITTLLFGPYYAYVLLRPGDLHLIFLKS